jgi:hypothetical protein
MVPVPRQSTAPVGFATAQVADGYDAAFQGLGSSSTSPILMTQTTPDRFADAGQSSVARASASMEQWLVRQFPDTKQIVTPWSDPAFQTEEYLTFLRALGYRKVRGHPAFGKPVHRRAVNGR